MFSIVAPQVRGKCAEDNIFAANNRAVALADEIGNDKVVNGTVGSILDEEGNLCVCTDKGIREIFRKLYRPVFWSFPP